jgi:RNase H-like domain found in reverse transcriptase/Reverse transcriptase (RNA-dependent DNA polymerase)
LIDRVGSAKYLTKLDMVKGYWQVPLDAESIPVSGFVTSFGHFRWRFMPFGCRNAPATFSRLVRNLLSGLEMFCAAYLDDIIIFSMSWADHKRHVAEVLRRIRNAGLTLNLSKCVFAVAELDYLGHRIGCNRIQPREQKIAALLQYGRPVDRKSLQSFLGLAEYYRRFLPNFSHMSAVLSNLLKKNVKFEWTEEAETAFVDLKSRLATRPILRPPDWSKSFCLAVDSSNIAVGGNLFQIIDGVEHPICFFSKKLDVHQQKYSTIEKEALGLILAVRAFSVYFGSSRVRVFTDHNPLVFLEKMCNHNQRLLRWSLELQEYCLDIEHRAGKDNLMPDLLSRSF